MFKSWCGDSQGRLLVCEMDQLVLSEDKENWSEHHPLLQYWQTAFALECDVASYVREPAVRDRDTRQPEPQALVYDILPWRKVPESDARSVKTTKTNWGQKSPSPPGIAVLIFHLCVGLD